MITVSRHKLLNILCNRNTTATIVIQACALVIRQFVFYSRSWYQSNWIDNWMDIAFDSITFPFCGQIFGIYRVHDCLISTTPNWKFCFETSILNHVYMLWHLHSLFRMMGWCCNQLMALQHKLCYCFELIIMFISARTFWRSAVPLTQNRQNHTCGVWDFVVISLFNNIEVYTLRLP